MSNLREAAQQALEALESRYASGSLERCGDAITALRAALAEDALQRLTDVQQEMEAHDPVDYRGWVLREVLFYNGEPVSHREPEQEPVAWGMARKDGLIFDVICPEEHESYEGEYTIPLYTAPPQRKPLTDEEIEELDDQVRQVTLDKGTPVGWFAMQFARAIEAAHGIKGEA